MGAAPSRETAAHSLPRAPFYGQRQQIVLIPFLVDFFPSADCALFRQFYEARCDPAVRYYHYTHDSASASSSALLDGVVACTAADTFPPSPGSIEALYRAYVPDGAEQLVYSDDVAMLSAYQRDPASVRPLPCAVAFLYDASPSAVAAPAEGAGAATTPTPTAGGASALPDGCVTVLGSHVKVTGFVGDVRRLFSPAGPREPHPAAPPGADDACELDLYLTKSAGDHNRTHVLLSAVYAYAEQWQRACLRYAAAKDREEAALAAAAATTVCATTTTAADTGTTANDGAPAERGSLPAVAEPEQSTAARAVPLPKMLKAHTAQLRDDVLDTARDFTASTSSYYKKFMQSVASPASLRSLFTMEAAAEPPTALLAEAGKEEDERGAGEPSAEEAELWGSGHAVEWAPPPLTAVRMRGRRTNVPLLCFLRELRTILLGIHAAAAASAGGSSDEDDNSSAVRVAALKDLVLWLEDLLATPALPASGGGAPASSSGATSAAHAEPPALVDTLLNVYACASVVQLVAEHIVDCLLHNLNPLEIPRALEQRRQQQQQQQQQPSSSLAAPRPLGLRLPDEDTIAEPWPPQPWHSPAAAAAAAPLPTNDDEALCALCAYLPQKFLYWVVGPSVESRRSATAAVRAWHSKGYPVVVGYDSSDEQPPSAVGQQDEALSSCLAPLSSSWPESAGEEERTALLDAGIALSLLPVESSERVPGVPRTLRVCRLPLEEVLLGELRDACKLAREAGLDDAHWIRREPAAAAEPEAELPAGHEDATGSRALEATGIVGDGASCLYRVVLASGAERVVAVTPFFLKTTRKKASKRKGTIKVTAGAHGTALDVFYTAPVAAAAAAPALPAPVQADAAAVPDACADELCDGAAPAETAAAAAAAPSPDEEAAAPLSKAARKKRNRRLRRAEEEAAAAAAAEPRARSLTQPPGEDAAVEEEETAEKRNSGEKEAATVGAAEAAETSAAPHPSLAAATVVPAAAAAASPMRAAHSSSAASLDTAGSATLPVAPPAPVDFHDDARTTEAHAPPMTAATPVENRVQTPARPYDVAGPPGYWQSSLAATAEVYGQYDYCAYAGGGYGMQQVPGADVYIAPPAMMSVAPSFQQQQQQQQQSMWAPSYIDPYAVGAMPPPPPPPPPPGYYGAAPAAAVAAAAAGGGGTGPGAATMGGTSSRYPLAPPPPMPPAPRSKQQRAAAGYAPQLQRTTVGPRELQIPMPLSALQRAAQQSAAVPASTPSTLCTSPGTNTFATEAVTMDTAVSVGSAEGSALRRHVSFKLNAGGEPPGTALAPATAGEQSGRSPVDPTSPGLPAPLSTLAVHEAFASSPLSPSAQAALEFHFDTVLSPTTNTSSTHYPQLQSPSSNAGSGLHVTVLRRRAHHHHHQRTGSYLSDATTGDGNGSQSGAHVSRSVSGFFGGDGAAGAATAQESESPTSSSFSHARQLSMSGMGRLPLSPRAGTGQGFIAGGESSLSSSMVRRTGQASPAVAATSAAGAGAVAGGSSVHSPTSPRAPVDGVIATSSTRSGDTGVTGSAKQRAGATGGYRWNWRAVGLNYGDED